MSGQHWWSFLVFWGVWLLIPLCVDVFDALWRLVLVVQSARTAPPYSLPQSANLPKISIVIPARNEQVNIDRCITSIKAQTYPHSLIEVIVVNDGSTDLTSNVVIKHMTGQGSWNGHIRLHNEVIPAQPFGGVINLVRGRQGGKPAAVNAGLAQANGDFILTVDSDMVMERDTVEQAVIAFLNEPLLMAATAHLIVDHNLLIEADQKARITLDAYGLPIVHSMSPSEHLLVSCQFLEYLSAFHVGRQAENATNTIFTLSGACAIFRAEALDMIGGYRGRTVSEDTDATLMLHRQDWHIGYLPQVHVRLAPVTNWTHLYSQRVRWQRGELEVVAVNLDRLFANPITQNLFWGWALRLRMQKDHSLALPRLVWVFLIFMLGLFGYSITLIMQAMIIMYGLYVMLEIGQVGAAYLFSRKSERQLIRLHFPFVLFLPLYRMATFWYRMSGVMLALHELPTWNVQGTGKRPDIGQRAISQVQDFVKSISRFWAE